MYAALAGGLAGVRERQAIRRADHRVGEIGGVLESLEDGDLAQNALALNTQHGAVEGAAHFACVLGGFGAAYKRVAGRRRAELENQIRMADQLIGEVLAVLEQIDGGFHQRRIRIETPQPLGIRQNFFEERLEAIAAAAQARSGDHGGELRRALIEEFYEIAGCGRRRGRRFGDQARRRITLLQRCHCVIHRLLCVDDSLIDIPNPDQVLVQPAL